MSLRTQCWTHEGKRNTKGYGVDTAKRALGESILVHRRVYEALVGPIPAGLELDHLCRVRSCYNPSHLEPVTHAENMRRSKAFLTVKTHCPQGHPYDEENTYSRPGDREGRMCKACNRAAQTRYNARQKQQRQDSITDQMRDLHRLAVENGMYDAADWLTRTFARIA